jgi:membrane protein
MHLSSLWPLIRRTVSAWQDDYAPSMGAAISYYTIFSIAPMLVIVVAVAGLVWGQEAVQGEISGQLTGLVGAQAAEAIQSMLQAAHHPAQGLLAGAISVVALVVGATTVFAELQSALDRIWRVPAAQKISGVWATLRTRLLSFGIVLALAFLLSTSLVASAAVSALGAWANGMLPAWQVWIEVLNVVVSLALSSVLFAAIFKLMPNAHVAWSDVWIGAGVTAVLFQIGKVLISVYIGKAGTASAFGAAGSLAVLLLWVYYAAQIFLLGAEFTWVYANEQGSRRGLAAPPREDNPTRSGEALLHGGGRPAAARVRP